MTLIARYTGSYELYGTEDGVGCYITTYESINAEIGGLMHQGAVRRMIHAWARYIEERMRRSAMR